MKLSKQWLQDYIELPESGEEIADLITMHIAEVEEVIDQAAAFNNMVVGIITEVKQHTNADKLRIAMVDIGKAEPVQIVCGGANLAEQQKVLVALPGAKVTWHGEGDLVEIMETKIRGEASFGMISAAEEVGLGEMFPSTQEREIIDLSHIDAAAGTPIADALKLNDVIIEIDNKTLTHRPDLFSQVGFARELSVVLNRPLSIPAYETNLEPVTKQPLNIEIDGEHCRRYIGGRFSVATNGESPAWMQQRLLAVGVNPRSAVVDITNYVMMEYGQPLHAFDAAKVENGTIVARLAKKGENLETLDGKTLELQPDHLVIADTQKPLALAGIMGGTNSEISDTTTEILLESANFHPTTIRKTAQYFGKRTEGSTRHEKKLQPAFTEYGFYRAAQLLREICGAELVSSVVDTFPKANAKAAEKQPIAIEVSYITRLIGIEIETTEITRILEGLECEVEFSQDTFTVTSPDFRSDINIQEDIIEEIARMHGYGKIPQQPLTSALHVPTKQANWYFGDKLVHFFAQRGATEIFSYSYYSQEDVDRLGLDAVAHIEVQNPMNPNQQYLRITALPGLLRSASLNQRNRFENLYITEYGHLYLKTSATNYTELPVVAGVVVDSSAQHAFRRVKGEIEQLLQSHGIEVEATVDADHKPFVEPGTHVSWYVDGQPIAQIGLTKASVVDSYDLHGAVAWFVIPAEYLGKVITEQRKTYVPFSTFPSIDLDISVSIPKSVNWATIQEIATKAGGKLVTSVQLFDMYTGKGVEDNHIAYGIRFILQANDRTLEMAEADTIRDQIIAKLQAEFNAIHRR